MKKIALNLWIAGALSMPHLPVNAENLLQVYQQAQRFDAQLQSQETGYLATLETKVQALASKKPQVTLGASTTLSRSDIFFDASVLSKTGRSNSLNGSYTLSLTKSLFNKSIDAGVAQADAGIAQSFANLESQRQSLLLRVAQRYFNFLLAQDSAEYAAAQSSSVERQLKQTKAFFDAGRSAITDVREAQARYDLTKAQVVSAKQQLAVAREALRVLTGKSYQTLNAPQPTLKLIMPQPNKLDSWVQAALKNNKTLVINQKAIEVAQASVNRERASRAPVVSLFARHTGSVTSGSSALDPLSTGLSAGIEASIPLSTGGATASKIRQAQLNVRQAQENYQYQARLVEEQVRSAFLSVESSIAQAQANRQVLLSSETAAKATQVGFQVGTRTAVDMLTALTAVFSARRDYASARYNYLLNLINLKLAAGVLAEQDLAQVSRLLTQPPSLQRAELEKQTQAILKPIDLDKLIGSGSGSDRGDKAAPLPTLAPLPEVSLPMPNLSLPPLPTLSPLPITPSSSLTLPALPSPSIPLTGSVVVR